LDAALLSVLPASARTLRVACREGGIDATVRGRGNRFRQQGEADYNVCDVDRTCDDICTFAIQADCLDWLLGPRKSEPPCTLSPSGACRSSALLVALPLGTGRRSTTRVIKFRRKRVVLRCRRSRPCTTPTTSTTLPASVNLSGDWTITATDIDGNCLPGVSFDDSLLLLHSGSDVTTCFLYAGSAVGGDLVLTNERFVTTPRCSYDWTKQLMGTLVDDDTLAITEHWHFEPRSSGDCEACTRTRTGIMSRRVTGCASHHDCLAIDPCSRCVDGACIVNPLCH
jgi:hypothetical protein